MGKIIASVRNARSIGAVATTLTDDIKFGFTAHALHLDVYGNLIASATDTMAGVVGNLNQFRIETTTSQPESTIDGADLIDFDHQMGLPQYNTTNTLTVDNQPKAFSTIYPFSPFVGDDSRNYGLQPGKGVQTSIDWNADATIDGKTYDMTVEGITNNTQPDPIGYIKFVRDSFTGVVGQDNKTRVTGNALLGIENFQTTEFDAIAASETTSSQSIQQQSLLYSDNIVAQFKPQRSWGMQKIFGVIRSAAALSGTQFNIGNFFIDLGINNTGKIGLDIAGRTVDINTLGGSADAIRVNAVVLVK